MQKSFAKNEILLDFLALIIYNYKSEKINFEVSCDGIMEMKIRDIEKII